jgi:WD40 repeat protein
MSVSSRQSLLAALLLTIVSQDALWGQGPALAPLQKEPLLRVETGGPTAFVTGLAFSPDGKKLYAAGLDKVVRVWMKDKDDRFVPSPTAYRVPVGPGTEGALNALAVSPDGKWLVAAGRSLFGGRAGFRQPGRVFPQLGALSDEARREMGSIYVFDTDKGDCRLLRGHLGPVMSLTFAPAHKDKPPLLVSVASEWDGTAFVGGVRLWDIQSGKQLASRSNLPDPKNLRPGVAVWHTGEDLKQLRVAVALPHGKLRLWDIENKELFESDDARWNNTVAYLPGKPGEERLLTASYNAKEGEGQVRSWKVPAKAGPQQDDREPALLGERRYPLALTTFSSELGAAVDRVAVISWAPEETNSFRLHVLALAKGAVKETARVMLWQDAAYAPVAASDPSGHTLAVAGNRDHQILLFATSDLLKNGAGARPQRLQSAGTAAQYVRFVQKGDQVGLVMSEAEATTPGKPPASLEKNGLVFDFTKAALVPYQAAWKIIAPKPADWQTKFKEVTDKEKRVLKRVFSVYQDGDLKGQVELSAEEMPTRYTLLPPGPSSPFKRPLLVVAFVDIGGTMLGLYDVASGQQVRQYAAHVDPIRSLAFSADGKLLASAAEDQLVCVWSLTDLEEHLGHHGMLRGVAVSSKEGKGLVLADIQGRDLADANGKTFKKHGVEKGDVVEGIVEAGKLQPLKTALAFYNALWKRKPGTMVTLRIQGRGDVALLVGQGIDERTPLLSLFITQPGKAKVRQWIGWSPVGPYDFSDGDAERLIGWHRNTGEVERPVTFALAKEYRKEFHKPGILRDLVESANTGKALETWKKKHEKKIEPVMSLWIAEARPGLPDPLGWVTVEAPPKTLVLSVAELPAGAKVDKMEWELLDTKERGKLSETAAGRWSADISKVAWKRGDYRIRVLLALAAPDAASYLRELPLRYRPARPRVQALKEHPLLADKAAYPLKVQIKPGTGECVIRLLKNKKKVGEPFEIEETFVLDREVKLDPGKNLIQIIVRNKNAPEGDDFEQDQLTLEVTYKTPEPLIALTRIIPVPDGEEVELDASKPGVPVKVSTATVRVVGKVEAPADLAELAWVSEKDGKRQLLALGENKKKVAIDQKVTLKKPGQPQTISFFAKTAASEEVKRSVLVTYLPALPALTLNARGDVEALEEERVQLEASLLWPHDRHPCQAVVVVNEKEIGASRAIKTTDEKLMMEAPLQPGDNWVQVKLKNDWHESLSPRIHVKRVRLPRVLKVTDIKKAKTSFVTLIALAESANDLPLTRVEINGRLPDVKDVLLKKLKEGKETATWEVTVANVPVRKSTNRLELRVGNADGWSRKSLGHEFEITAADLPRAEIVLLSPQRDTSVEDPELKTLVSIRSASTVAKVEILLNGGVVHRRGPFALKDKEVSVDLEETLSLKPGANTLKVLATNDGGEQTTSPVVVTYTYKPLRVVIDSLELPGKKEVKPLSGESVGGWLSFGEVPAGEVWVRGRVLGDKADDQLARLKEVRVYVNGAQEAPVMPEAADKQERSFRIALRLDRAEGNEIELQLPPGLTHESGSRRKCLVACAKPTVRSKQQAHLLIIDTEKRNEKELREQVLAALKATPKGEKEFTLAGYSEPGILYGPLTGARATRQRVNELLIYLQRNLTFLRARDATVRHVVYCYFRGGESIAAARHVFWTSESTDDPELRWSGVSCEDLQSLAGDCLGQLVFLLDVNRVRADGGGSTALEPSADRVLQWPETPHVALWRYAWWDEPAKQKEEARLLVDWQKAVAGKAKQLRDVGLFIGGKFESDPPRPSRAYGSLLTLVQRVPSGLLPLPIGGLP